MNTKIKEKLYISAFLLAALSVYAIPFLLLNHKDSLRQDLLNECVKTFPTLIDFCLSSSREESAPNLLDYSIPFLPMAILLWGSWILGIKYKVSIQNFPTKIINVVNWISIVISWLAIGTTLFYIFADFASTNFGTYTILPWLSVCILSVPLICMKGLVSKKHQVDLTWLKRSLYMAIATPFVGLIVFIISNL